MVWFIYITIVSDNNFTYFFIDPQPHKLYLQISTPQWAFTFIYLFIYFYFCYIFKEYLNQLNISAILNYRAQKGTISLQLKIQGRRYISRLSN